MQQYFIDFTLKNNDVIRLNDEVIHHLKNVLRKNSDYTFRLVDINQKVFLAHLLNNNEDASYKYYVSDIPDKFEALAKEFLNKETNNEKSQLFNNVTVGNYRKGIKW